MDSSGTAGNGTRIILRPREARAAFLGDLPLDPDLDQPIVVDASELVDCHPMFALRLRLFVDWHQATGNVVRVVAPGDPRVAQQVADPVHMAVSELCDNARQHGRNSLGTYVAADQVGVETGEFRLAIGDLGIGIPEHIRACYPEWQDDTAAIVSALQRGVTGTGDPHRGNGFAEVVDDVNRVLVRAQSAVHIEIRSAKGGVVLDLLDGRVAPRPARVERARRGTWITYTVRTIRA
jgi:hypothetical protein